MFCFAPLVAHLLFGFYDLKKVPKTPSAHQILDSTVEEGTIERFNLQMSRFQTNIQEYFHDDKDGMETAETLHHDLDNARTQVAIDRCANVLKDLQEKQDALSETQCPHIVSFIQACDSLQLSQANLSQLFSTAQSTGAETFTPISCISRRHQQS